MDRQAVYHYVKQKYHTTPDFPWKDENAVLRHGDSEKWYGVVLSVSREKLGLEGAEQVDILNVKCDPMLIGSLLMQPGYHRAYHMNKEQWISIRLDGSAPEGEVKSLIDLSFELTEAKKQAGKPKPAVQEESHGAGKNDF